MNKSSFINLGMAMANVNHIIDKLEGIGLSVDDASFDGKLYNTADILFREMIQYINMTVAEENDFCNMVMQIGIDEISKLEEVWDKYGIK